MRQSQLPDEPPGGDTALPADSPADRRPLLELQRLGIAARSGGAWQQIVDTVSLVVGEGERVGLVGESGCGKSLTALACLGLLPDGTRVSTGGARVDGIDVVAATQRQLESLRGSTIGLVMQETAAALNPTFTVGFQLIETGRLHQGWSRRGARARASSALAELGLDDPEAILRAYPHQLSGGQAQRVNLALALAGRPRLLLADEPVTALDVTTQAQVLRLILDVCDRTGMALLLISHDLAVVGSLVDRIAVMLAGELVEVGPSETVLSCPAHPYTRMLVEAGPGTSRASRASSTGETRGPRREVGCRHVRLCELRRPECETYHPLLEELARDHLARCPVVVKQARSGRAADAIDSEGSTGVSDLGDP